MAIRYTKAAEEDLEGIFVTGLLEHGEAQAAKYRDKLKRSLEFVAHNPLAVREREELTPSVRVHPSGVHLIMFLVEGGDVLIVRVRHSHEDWLNDPVGDGL